MILLEDDLSDEFFREITSKYNETTFFYESDGKTRIANKVCKHCRNPYHSNMPENDDVPVCPNCY